MSFSFATRDSRLGNDLGAIMSERDCFYGSRGFAPRGFDDAISI